MKKREINQNKVFWINLQTIKKKKKMLLEKVFPGQITNKIPGMIVKYEKKRNKSK